jgi:hypothetical protein
MNMINESRGQQFIYWDLRRKGMTQSEIARNFEISRQSVNKSVKLQERYTMYRLIESAKTTGSLVENFDASRGTLIGINPQLGNLPFLTIVDQKNGLRTFYDQSGNRDRETALSVLGDLKDVVSGSLNMDLRDETSFKSILRRIQGF